MKRLGFRTAVAMVVVALTLGLLVTPALARSSSGTTTPTTNASKRSEACSAVRKRLADAPQILSRIEANLNRLNLELDNARLPARRAVLVARIDRLEVLRADLARKIADARRACGTV